MQLRRGMNLNVWPDQHVSAEVDRFERPIEACLLQWSMERSSIGSSNRWLDQLGRAKTKFLDFMGSRPISAFLLIIVLLSLYAISIPPYDLKVTHNNFDLFEGDPDPIKIVFISDNHSSFTNSDYFERIINTVNAQDPDLILIAGDFVNSEYPFYESMNQIKNLKSKYGVYAVLGNHDYSYWDCSDSSYEYADKLEAKLEGMGIKVLRNENEILNINGLEFALVGLDEFWACKSNYVKASKNLSDNIPKIILVHNQDAVSYSWLKGENLILAAHTHCGQVRLPIIGSIPKLIWFSGDVDMGYKKIDENNEIYVTCGVTPGYPYAIRFLSNPEISVLYVN